MVTPVPISAVGGTSLGYGGTIEEDGLALASLEWGKQYGVGTAGAWAPSVVAAADRTVQFAAGPLFGVGIRDEIPNPLTIQLDSIGSGSRVDLLIARRNWSGTGGTTSITAVPATSSGDIPGGLNHNVGALDDQPLALYQVTAGQSLPTLIADLRVWQANGGTVAVSEKVLQYLNAPGTQITIGDTVWTRVMSASGVASWQRTDAVSRYERLWTVADGSLRPWPANTDGQMVAIQVPNARPGRYMLSARAVVSHGQAAVRAYFKKFTVNGTQHGDNVQDDVPAGSWVDRSLTMPLSWAGGTFMVQYIGRCDTLATVKQARLTVSYLGPAGW